MFVSVKVNGRDLREISVKKELFPIDKDDDAGDGLTDDGDDNDADWIGAEVVDVLNVDENRGEEEGIRKRENSRDM